MISQLQLNSTEKAADNDKEPTTRANTYGSNFQRKIKFLTATTFGGQSGRVRPWYAFHIGFDRRGFCQPTECTIRVRCTAASYPAFSGPRSASCKDKNEGQFYGIVVRKFRPVPTAVVESQRDLGRGKILKFPK